MIIRPSQIGDELAVARVHVRSWQAAYRGLLPDEFLDDLDVEQRAARYRFGDDRPDVPQTLVALVDGTVGGFATTGPSRELELAGTGELYALYVDPDHWGTGMGRALIAEARAALSRQGFGDGALWVLVGNERAERFYRADGWVAEGIERQDRIGAAFRVGEGEEGLVINELRYRRPLP